MKTGPEIKEFEIDNLINNTGETGVTVYTCLKKVRLEKY